MKRFLITILAIFVGIVFAIAVFRSSAPQTSKQPSTPGTTFRTPRSVDRTDDTLIVQASDELPFQTQTTVQPTSVESASDQPTPLLDNSLKRIEGLHAQPADEAKVSTIGSLDPARHKLKVELAGFGGSIRFIWLAEYNEKVGAVDPYLIHARIKHPSNQGYHYPFSARGVTVNGQYVELQTKRWHNTDKGQYTITLADGEDHPVLRITRTYSLPPGDAGYEIICRQHFENLSNQPLRIIWEQNGQNGVTEGGTTYIDQRYFVAGYYDLDRDKKKNYVVTDNKKTFVARRQVLGAIDKGQPALWPNSDIAAHVELVWLASLNRYFGMVIHQVVTGEDHPPENKTVPTLDQAFDHVGIQVIGKKSKNRSQQDDLRRLYYTLTSKPFDLLPQASSDLNTALFAGPRENKLFDQLPFKWLGFKNLIRYSLGGCCTAFTFQWLAHWLLGFLRFLEHYVVFDWGVAIIILVLVVRGLLHPLTKKSQISMMKMGKMMQALQPEMEKLKKKYKDDQKKLQQETMKLYREKGVNPANILGCLPMFLQMPIWIALYAMLFLAIELRHEPAFYGFFQLFGGWQFLSDLSTYDSFIKFGDGGFRLPLIKTFVPASLNILPLLMGVVFYFNQKLTTPPPANEQAAQQQKIMKYMTLLFPVMLYPAPSGLTLYILASTAAGMIDSYIVRKHIREQEEAGTLFDKKQPKKAGFMHRIRQAVEARQRELAERRGLLDGKQTANQKRYRKRRT